MTEKNIVFDDDDDGVLSVDITSELTVCLVIKSKIHGFGICAISRNKNPLIFEAVRALYRAIETEQGC